MKVNKWCILSSGKIKEMLSRLSDNKIFRIGVLGDGMCFLHSILRASSPEIYNRFNDKEKGMFIKRIRENLAIELTYEKFLTLGNGNISQVYNYTQYKNSLGNTSEWIGEEFFEYISDYFNLDIYILSDMFLGLYPIGCDIGLLYRKRKSVIILNIDNKHYEAIGFASIKEPNKENIITSFTPNDPIIEQLYNML